MSKWQKIETAPKDGTWVWVFWPTATWPESSPRDIYCVAQWADDRWVDADDFREFTLPTHWMPLPPPPEES